MYLTLHFVVYDQHKQKVLKGQNRCPGIEAAESCPFLSHSIVLLCPLTCLTLPQAVVMLIMGQGACMCQ